MEEPDPSVEARSDPDHHGSNKQTPALKHYSREGHESVSTASSAPEMPTLRGLKTSSFFKSFTLSKLTIVSSFDKGASGNILLANFRGEPVVAKVSAVLIIQTVEGRQAEATHVSKEMALSL